MADLVRLLAVIWLGFLFMFVALLIGIVRRAQADRTVRGEAGRVSGRTALMLGFFALALFRTFGR